MSSKINTVGTSFLPDKSQVPVSILQSQRTTNAAPQANNSFLFAELAANVVITSDTVAEAFTWNVVEDQITLGYTSPFSAITLFGGVWETQVRLFFESSDGTNGQITMNLPENDYGGLSGTSLYSASGYPLLFSELVYVPDPLIAKTLPYSITSILGAFSSVSGTPGVTMTVTVATLLIKRIN